MTITVNDLQFNQQILAQKAEVVEDYGTFIRLIVFTAFGKIVDGTPVLTGRARGNWFVSRTDPASEVDGWEGGPAEEPSHDANAAQGAERSMARLADVDFSPPFDVFWITNNLPYIEPLELGNSQQAPDGWIRIALAATEAEVEAGLT